MSIVSTHHPPLTSRQLLVSVQSEAEAQLALDAGVSWIDLKDPSQGSLGQAAVETAGRVSRLLSSANRPVQASAALGEWQSISSTDFSLPDFPIVKLGLADASPASISGSMLDILYDKAKLSGTAVVWTLYADRQLAHSPDVSSVLELASRFQSPYVLIDTWQKGDSNLFDWMTVEELEMIRREVNQLGADLVVAGSLRETDWPNLDRLGPIIVGVRGAVCQSSHQRTSQLCPTRLKRWLSWSKKYAP